MPKDRWGIAPAALFRQAEWETGKGKPSARRRQSDSRIRLRASCPVAKFKMQFPLFAVSPVLSDKNFSTASKPSA
eukprot:2317196-Rhodomonas_salina.1